MHKLWRADFCKDYNFNCHYKTEHGENYKNLIDAEWEQIDVFSFLEIV